MAYDEELAQRIRKVLANEAAVTEKKMFGGVGFLLHGNMVCGVRGDALIVRVGAARHKEALAQPHTGVFDKGRRPLVGWVEVASPGVASVADVRRWLRAAVELVRGLPPK
jgi:TfoX/Sxy family transcriptional regulator of competence genes